MEPSTRTPPAPLRIRVAPEEATVRFWGLRDQPLATWLWILVAGGVSAAVGHFLGNEWYGWGTLVILVVTLWRSWVPLRYEIGPAGITQVIFGRRTRILWTSILNYRVYSSGVLLLPDAAVTPLSPLRGMFLPWGSQREPVLANIEYYLASWASSQSTTSR